MTYAAMADMTTRGLGMSTAISDMLPGAARTFAHRLPARARHHWKSAVTGAFLALLLFLPAPMALALPPLQAMEITATTAVSFADKKNLFVLEDSENKFRVEDVLNRSDGFRDVSHLPAIAYYQPYWIVQKLRNTQDSDYQLRIDPTGWESIQSYAVDERGNIRPLKVTGAAWVSYNHLADVNPSSPQSTQIPSAFTLYTLPRQSEVTLITKVVSGSTLPARTFSLKLFNHPRYLEIRRFGVYIEGILLGILFALAIFGGFSAYTNKDKTSLAYSIWIVVAMINVAANYMPEGPRLAEFFVDMEGIRFLHHYLYRPTFIASGYAQALFYAVFAATFLNVKKHAPWLYKFTIVYIAYLVLHYLFTNLVPHHVPQLALWLPNGVLTFILLFSFFGVALSRYRHGHTDAGFFTFAVIPYLLFRTIYVLGLAGIPSPFALMEPAGIGLLLQDTNLAQAVGICSEAIIMALAVIGRTRWLQTQLARNIEEQKRLVENQNRLLEDTVQERTQELQTRTNELAEQHKALDKAHRIVVSSVDYASRLQRSQLPSQHRIEGRFSSLGVIWSPRDTIGGDLWWLSSSPHRGIFTLAVADCTGHGVPGAMLSLLVSNSLERIYSSDPEKSPAAALLMLDQLVRAGLNQDSAHSESDDGCDAMIMQINRERSELIFAGAKIGAFQLKAAGELIRHRPARASLGYREPIPSEHAPVDRVITAAPGDTFVIVTDGFTDQVGGSGPRPSSLGNRRIEDILSSLAGQSAEQVANQLEERYHAWRGDEVPRDDVTVVAFQL